MQDAMFISGLIGLISLIAFIFIAININKIKIMLENKEQEKKSTNYANPFNMGELREFQGKKQEALECYLEAYFNFRKLEKSCIEKGLKMENGTNHKEKIKAKIIELGGTIKEI